MARRLRIEPSKIGESNLIEAAQRLRDNHGKDLGRFRYQQMVDRIRLLGSPNSRHVKISQDIYGVPIYQIAVSDHFINYQKFGTHIWVLQIYAAKPM